MILWLVCSILKWNYARDATCYVAGIVFSKLSTLTLCHLRCTQTLLPFTNLLHSNEQGMGAGLLPAVLDLEMLDEIVPVHSDEAMAMANELWMIGLPVGVSAGAIVEAAVQVCGRSDFSNKTAVCIIPSFGERYFTHPMFGDIKERAEGLVKQPLPEPFDNTAYGFATERG